MLLINYFSKQIIVRKYCYLTEKSQQKVHAAYSEITFLESDRDYSKDFLLS